MGYQSQPIAIVIDVPAKDITIVTNRVDWSIPVLLFVVALRNRQLFQLLEQGHRSWADQWIQSTKDIVSVDTE